MTVKSTHLVRRDAVGRAGIFLMRQKGLQNIVVLLDLALTLSHAERRAGARGFDAALFDRVHAMMGGATLGVAHRSRRSRPILLTLFLASFFEIEDAGKVEAAVLNVLIKANRTSSVEVIAIHVLADVTTDLSREGLTMTRTLGNRRDEVTFSDELLAEAVEVLHDGRTR